MTFSAASLALFAELLDQVQLSGTHPNLVEIAGRIALARQELDAARAALSEPDGASNGITPPQPRAKPRAK